MGTCPSYVNRSGILILEYFPIFRDSEPGRARLFELWLSSGKRARLRSYITVDMADMLTRPVTSVNRRMARQHKATGSAPSRPPRANRWRLAPHTAGCSGRHHTQVGTSGICPLFPICPPPFACHLNTSFSVPKRTGGGHRPTPDRWRRSYTTESIVCVFSTRRTSEEHKAAGISELRPPNGDAEKRLMDIERRWNVYDVVLCKRIGLTDYDGNPDWGQFEKFLETLKRRPFAEKELNAERMGTQVRKAAGIPTALVPHVWRCGQNSDPFDQTQLTGAVFPAVLSEATPYATVTMEMQRLFAGDCNRRPAAIAAAINDDIYGAGWQDWVPFGVWLCEEYPLLLRSARVQGRRDQCRLAAEVVREPGRPLSGVL